MVLWKKNMTTEEETRASYKLVFENQPVGFTEGMRRSHKALFNLFIMKTAESYLSDKIRR